MCTLSREAALSKLFCLSFEKGSTLKGKNVLLQGSILKEKNLLPVGANSFLLEQTPF